MAAAFQELEQRWGEIADIESGLGILGWDQEVMMPRGGVAARSRTMATLTGLIHERKTDPAMVALVRRLSRKGIKLTPRQRRAVALARKAVDKAANVPAELARKIALAESSGVESWREAREKGDFSLFADELSRMVDLKRELARVRSKRGKVYDALLDDFEPGATMDDIDPLLTELKTFTQKLLKRVVNSGVEIDVSPLVGRFDVDAQRSFARSVVLAMGIDLDCGRMDLSTHPFCGGVGPGDVRMTSRYDPSDMRGGLFGVIHEAGHGLYEQGLDPRRAGTPLGGAISMAIHESQSRLWENNVGRSRPFWKYWLPRLRRAHPQLKGVNLEKMWRAVNCITPSMIRVEADELTYNLHIVLRYEIERDLIEGRIEVRDLPDRWNGAMVDLLGIEPRNAAEGVLQDIHWASGLFGYFPTYAIGNLYAAQIMESARKGIRGLDRRIEQGDLVPLRDWLKIQIHCHDQVHDAAKTVRRVTGKPLSTDAFRRHITRKVKAIYG